MKILVVYNNSGQLVFTQSNATEQYKCIVENIPENKEVIGVDANTDKCILKDKEATTEDLKKVQEELTNKNEELLKTQAEYAQFVFDSLLNN